jgi:hypothetical protein
MKKNKVKDMIRSILPSKSSKSVKQDKAFANRKNRRVVRETLQTHADREPDEWHQERFAYDGGESECISIIHEADKVHSHDIRLAVFNRRDADKISHFVRWCKEITKHIPDDDPKTKYYFVAGKIGGTADVIRKHALGHFLDPEWDFNLAWGKGFMLIRKSSPIIFERQFFERALREAYETHHKALNKLLKQHALTFKKCEKDKDVCAMTKVVKKWPWYYVPITASKWGSSRFGTSDIMPLEGTYKPGTLSQRYVTEEVAWHDSSICKNRLIITKPEDLDKLTQFFFGSDKGWTKSYHRHSLAPNSVALMRDLCEFFYNTDLMQEIPVL